MTDDELLRQSLSSISDRAEPVDLLTGSLNRSRRIRRNRTLTGAGATVAVVALIGSLAWQLGPRNQVSPPLTPPTRTTTATPTTTAPPTTAPTTAAPTTAAPSTAAPTTAAPTTTTRTSRTVRPGCPVTAAKLDAALVADAELADALGHDQSTGWTRITCYQGFAQGLLNRSEGEWPSVIFRFDARAGRWIAITGGTSIRCAKYMPADVISHLPSCHENPN